MDKDWPCQSGCAECDWVYSQFLLFCVDCYVRFTASSLYNHWQSLVLPAYTSSHSTIGCQEGKNAVKGSLAHIVKFLIKLLWYPPHDLGLYNVPDSFWRSAESDLPRLWWEWLFSSKQFQLKLQQSAVDLLISRIVFLEVLKTYVRKISYQDVLGIPGQTPVLWGTSPFRKVYPWSWHPHTIYLWWAVAVEEKQLP